MPHFDLIEKPVALLCPSKLLDVSVLPISWMPLEPLQRAPT
ncbi:hypothetical protein RESH_03470 [Rhodopirellula europaea SH398]|uniref:Uncharacterized protein n=1 Tax=Rhodopirellula europaea SH398 TaxID=1263868 RepID=M5SI38_9BACT|nr:hypothetical protein RESH_03470 [Rhodopirellula europaea SH398]